jgi:hypothetical protein
MEQKMTLFFRELDESSRVFLSFQIFYVRQSTFVAHLCAQEVLLTIYVFFMFGMEIFS